MHTRVENLLSFLKLTYGDINNDLNLEKFGINFWSKSNTFSEKFFKQPCSK